MLVETTSTKWAAPITKVEVLAVNRPEFCLVYINNLLLLFRTRVPDNTRYNEIRQLTTNRTSPQRAVHIHSRNRSTATPITNTLYTKRMVTLRQQPKLPLPGSSLRQDTIQTDTTLNLLTFLQSLDVLLLLLALFGVLLSLLGSERVQTLLPAGAADVSVHVGALAASRAVAGGGEGADRVFSWVGVTKGKGFVVVPVSFLRGSDMFVSTSGSV